MSALNISYHQELITTHPYKFILVCTVYSLAVGDVAILKVYLGTHVTD